MLKLGIERINEFESLFKGKSVGLITNPTGVEAVNRIRSFSSCFSLELF